jgi:hypothetical protein
MSVSFDWNGFSWGTLVGWIWIKLGFAKKAPFLCAFHAAEALELTARVER